jgi:hypothetical protein
VYGKIIFYEYCFTRKKTIGGEKMRTKTICIGSVFPSTADEIWDKIQHVKTLQYIAYPYATFSPLGNGDMTWKEGKIFKFRFKLFGFLSLGIHTINIMVFDKDALTIYTTESNKTVPVWNHRITMEETSKSSVKYTDEVEIDAGWKTIFVVAWAKMFYRHRQKKWLKILRKNN